MVLLAAVLVAVPVCVGVRGLNGQVSAKTPLAGGPRAESHPKNTGHPSSEHVIQPSVPSLFQPSVIDSHAPDGLANLVPFRGGTPVSPFRFAGSLDAREQAIGCLAAAAWYEAGNDAVSQRSVIQVVLNRVKHPAFPKTVCGVVLQGSERKTGCQFSFTCDGSIDRRRPSPDAWQLARVRAESAIEGAVDGDVADATHYHADYVVPWWSAKLQTLAKVGRHIFYRWPGQGGSLLKTALLEGENAAALPRLGIGPAGSFVGLKTASVTPAAKPQIMADVVALTAMDMSNVVPVPVAAPKPIGAMVVALNMTQPSGRWAVDALRQCSGSGCRVLGYADASAVSRNEVRPDSAKDVPQFMMVKDRSSGMTITLWDCKVAPRPDSAQCMPDEPAAVRSLFRDRTAG